MTQLLNIFFTFFLPKFLLVSSIVFSIYIMYIFIRCIRKTQNLSEALSKTDKTYFYLAISYIFTYILL